jgi:hypothetical protein
MTKKRDKLKFEHTSRRSKLINLYVAFKKFKFNIHACVVYASCRFE